MTDEEVIDLISQTCVMSKSLDDYEGAAGGQGAGGVGLGRGGIGWRRLCCARAGDGCGWLGCMRLPFTRASCSAAGRKGTAITCAKRMSQFLGDERIREKVVWAAQRRAGCCCCCRACAQSHGGNYAMGELGG